MNTGCIIFDLDGTLVDSKPLGFRALLDLLPEIDESVEALTLRYRGRRFTETLADLKRRHHCEVPEDFEPFFRAHAAALFSEQLQPIPGAVEMLSNLDKPCCIASSGPLPKIQHSLHLTGMTEFFGNRLFSAYEIGSWKPQPDLFLHAAGEMKTDPEHCIVVEDSPVGVAAARAAGIRVFHFTSQATENNSPDYQAFANMAELAALLADGEMTGE